MDDPYGRTGDRTILVSYQKVLSALGMDEEFVQLVFMCILCVEYTYVHKIENYVYFSFGF